MDIVNADYGIDGIPAEPSKRKWYRWYRFPLLPMVSYRKADEYNPADFCFDWLNLRIWSMMSPDVGIEIKAEDIGIYFRLYLPYLIIHIWLFYFPLIFHQKIWRKGKED